jgi:protocatechuate 3,4-dioxygenase beta subunit
MVASMRHGEMTAAVLCALALLTPAVRGQGSGVIEGLVVNSVTQAGIGGAKVAITNDARGGAQATTHNATTHNATTDNAGRFHVEGLAPGNYVAEVEHPHFADAQSDQTARVSFTVGASGEAARVRVDLIPRSSLRGKLVDSEGKPIPDVRVYLFRLRYSGSYDCMTDKEGRFEFEEVRPTAYVLAADPPVLNWAPSGPDGERNTLARTYYPNTVDRRQAAPIVIAPGADLGGFDIRIAASPVFRIRGRVVDDAGNPVKVGLWLVSEDRLDTRGFVESSEADGSFEFPKIHPGSWRLTAEVKQAVKLSMKVVPPGLKRPDSSKQLDPTLVGEYVQRMKSGLSAGGSLPDGVTVLPDEPVGTAPHPVDAAMFLMMVATTLRGSTTIEVRRQDVDQVELRLSTPFKIPFSAVREETDGGDPKPAKGSIVLTSLDGFHEAKVNRYAGAPQFEEMFRGRYKVSMGDAEPGYYLAAAMLGDRDIVGQEVELGPGSPPIRAIFRPRSGGAKGSVDSSPRATVVLLPREEAVRELEGMSREQCSADGHFEIGGLRPGDYYAWAFERLDAEAFKDPSFVGTLLQRAASVTVKSGETATVALSVTPWPE